jgi:hypothetical protein
LCQLDRAAVSRYDARAHRQTDARADAQGFGGEERLEDLTRDLGRHARTVIGHLDAHTARIPTTRDAQPARRRDLLQGMLGVDDQVHDDLRQLVAVRKQGRQIGRQLAHDLDVAGAQAVARELEGHLDQLVDLHQRPSCRLLASEGQVGLDDP